MVFPRSRLKDESHITDFYFFYQVYLARINKKNCQ